MRQKEKKNHCLHGASILVSEEEFARKQVIQFPMAIIIKEIRDTVTWLDTDLERVIWEELLEKWTFELRCGGSGGVSHAREK